MSDFDSVIRGGTLVTPQAVLEADIGLAGGAIAALTPGLSGSAPEELDARGLHVFPGVIDAHVHFNEPGRAHWEGLETGSRALAAGGGTLFFDMPLNAHPPTIDTESFRLKLAAAEKSSLVDFAFWGGLVSNNLDRLAALAECGVVGFKAFMCPSGIDDFPWVNDRTLREGMNRAAELGLPVAVHAESEPLTRRLTQERLAAGRTSIRDYLDSRPVAAELDAIGRALELAVETGCSLHVVHVTCAEGIRLISEAQRRGLNVSSETCPHYLALTAEDMVAIGATAKCAPPLRSAADQEQLWERLLAGEITTVGSDHSPSPPEMKQDANFFKVWGGISSVQLTLPLLLTEAAGRGKAERGVPAAPSQNRTPEPARRGHRALPSLTDAGTEFAFGAGVLPLIANLLSDRVAARFKLPAAKGRIAVGADADLTLVDLAQVFEVKSPDLHYRHKHTPYLGRKLRGRVVRTLLRGKTVFNNGKFASKSLGCLVKPLP